MIGRWHVRYPAGVNLLWRLLVGFLSLSCHRSGTQKGLGQYAKSAGGRLQLITHTSAGGRLEVNTHSPLASRGNELTRKILVRCRLSSLLLVLLNAACAASVWTSAEITMLSLLSVENQPI